MTDERLPDRDPSMPDAIDADRAEPGLQQTDQPIEDREVALARSTEREVVDDANAWSSMPLLDSGITTDLRNRWTDIQTDFVDEPRRAVEQADGLVAEAIKRLADSFTDARSRLEQQWSRGGDVSTEDLRLALRRYRAFFGRLLEV